MSMLPFPIVLIMCPQLMWLAELGAEGNGELNEGYPGE